MLGREKGRELVTEPSLTLQFNSTFNYSREDCSSSATEWFWVYSYHPYVHVNTYIILSKALVLSIVGRQFPVLLGRTLIMTSLTDCQ